MKKRSLSLVLAGLGFLSGVSVPFPLNAAEPAITYQQVVDYLRLEVKEEKIVRLVEGSPTTFVLGADQIRQLKELGASERLISSLTKRGQAADQSGGDIRDFVLILDCSGSMKDEAERGLTKFQAAQRAAVDLVRSVPEQRNLAIIVYGHDLTERCSAIEVVRDLSPIDAAGYEDVAAMIADLHPAADTPIAASLEIATRMLSKSTSLAKVVLITDGMESCGGDPASAAAVLASMPHLKGGVDVIGFGLKAVEIGAVERIAKAGKGQFYNASNVAQLRESVERMEEVIKKSKLNETEEGGLTALDRLLIKQLSDANVNVRMKAAQSLGKRKVRGAIPELQALLARNVWDWGAQVGDSLGSNTTSDGSKDEALNSLLQIDRQAAEQGLIGALKSENAYSVAWAAFHLGENRMKNAAPALAETISDGEWNLFNQSFLGHKTWLLDGRRVIALEVLKKLNREKAEEALLKAAESKDAQVRAWATDMLTQVASESP